MKRLFFLLVYIFLAAALAGCRSSPAYKDGVEVIVDDGGQFPSFLVGTWKAKDGGWEFVFEPDGKISSAIVSIGRAKLQPGRKTPPCPCKWAAKEFTNPACGRFNIPASSESLSSK